MSGVINEIASQRKVCDKFINSGMLSESDVNEMMIKLKAMLLDGLITKRNAEIEEDKRVESYSLGA